MRVVCDRVLNCVNIRLPSSSGLRRSAFRYGQQSPQCHSQQWLLSQPDYLRQSMTKVTNWYSWTRFLDKNLRPIAFNSRPLDQPFKLSHFPVVATKLAPTNSDGGSHSIGVTLGVTGCHMKLRSFFFRMNRHFELRNRATSETFTMWLT